MRDLFILGDKSLHLRLVKRCRLRGLPDERKKITISMSTSRRGRRLMLVTGLADGLHVVAGPKRTFAAKGFPLLT